MQGSDLKHLQRHSLAQMLIYSHSISEDATFLQENSDIYDRFRIIRINKDSSLMRSKLYPIGRPGKSPWLPDAYSINRFNK